MDPQERDSEIGDESPASQNEEDLTDGEGESPRDIEDSCDGVRRHGMLSEHGDVLAKLKMQVRDIKEDFESARHMTFPTIGTRNIATEGFQLPVPFPFPHPAAAFLPPMTAPQQTASGSSGSSHSSEGSASSQHNWSFEEQFKQLYEINDCPKRKQFLDELFAFMQKRGTPINRLPIMAKSVLDLYELYNLVIARGGLVDVINKKLWQEIIKGLHLPSSITSAAFTLRTQYMKYLYPFECDKLGLSTQSELQAAIDGNRREGRRSSYGQYETVQRSPNPAQMSPLSLVSPQQQQQLAARLNSVMSGGISLHNGAHHPTHPHPMGQPLNGGPIPGMPANDLETKVCEYVRFLNKEILGSPTTMHRQGEASPPTASSPLNPLEMSRMALWSLYNNNNHHIPSPPEPQKEALNLSEPAVQVPSSPSVNKRDTEHMDTATPPPAKRVKEEEKTTHLPQTTSIKINSRGDSRNGGDNSLVVSMELNGVTYQGVLFAQSSSARTAIAS